MELEEDQEGFILNKVSDSTGKAIIIAHAGQDIREAFEMVLLKIQALSEKQNKLVNETEKLHDFLMAAIDYLL